jgi:hypothetical protein
MDAIIVEANERLLQTPDHTGNCEYDDTDPYPLMSFWDLFESGDLEYTPEIFNLIYEKIKPFPLINDLPHWSRSIVVNYIAFNYIAFESACY